MSKLAAALLTARKDDRVPVLVSGVRERNIRLDGDSAGARHQVCGIESSNRDLQLIPRPKHTSIPARRRMSVEVTTSISSAPSARMTKAVFGIVLAYG